MHQSEPQTAADDTDDADKYKSALICVNLRPKNGRTVFANGIQTIKQQPTIREIREIRVNPRFRQQQTTFPKAASLPPPLDNPTLDQKPNQDRGNRKE